MKLKEKVDSKKELTELNFTKVTDNFEKVELEFDENYEINNDSSKAILSYVRFNGDIGPDNLHYDLEQSNEFRKLPITKNHH